MHTHTATNGQASWGLCQLVRELSVNCWRCLWLAEASVHHHGLCVSVCLDNHPLEQEGYQSESCPLALCETVLSPLSVCVRGCVCLFQPEGLIGLACS